MKRVVIIVSLLICLVVVGVLIQRYLSTSQNSETDSQGFLLPTKVTNTDVKDPSEFAVSFYTWYLQNRVENPVFPYTESSREALKIWLTEDFFNGWDEQVTDSNGMDPVLLTDENPPASGTDLTATVITESERNAVIQLILSNGTASEMYTVELVRDSGGWKVSGIYAGP
jgi:hypothetical protein